MINVEAINTVDPGADGSTINIERIKSQLSLLREKIIAPADSGERHSVRCTGWPLVFFENRIPVFKDGGQMIT